MHLKHFTIMLQEAGIGYGVRYDDIGTAVLVEMGAENEVSEWMFDNKGYLISVCNCK